MKSYHFETISSTSTYLKENYQIFDHLTFISTDYQTNGHGRRTKIWESKSKQNLLFSVLIKNKTLVDKFSSLSLLSAVAIFNTLKKLNIKASIKWPNDVYVNNKKICGILLEGITENNNLSSLIIGIGLNINQVEFESFATSIKLIKNINYNIDEIKKIVYQELISLLNQLENNDNSYLKTVKDHNYLLNKEVYAEINNQKQLVKVIDINDDNTLLVEINNKLINLNTGEITFHK